MRTFTGKDVKVVRNNFGLSRTDFGRRVGVGQSMIWAIEAGRKNISADLQKRIQNFIYQHVSYEAVEELIEANRKLGDKFKR